MARWLLDTNVLLRLQETSSEAYDAVVTLGENGDIPCVTPQVLVEFWCAATRPAKVNGLEWPISTAAQRVTGILEEFCLLKDYPEVFDFWLDLVRKHEIKGKKVHDARLVAVMQAHGVENLLTFNTADFAAFDEIKAIHPRDVK
jgi:predicted nucleic acid-binding protein